LEGEKMATVGGFDTHHAGVSLLFTLYDYVGASGIRNISTRYCLLIDPPSLAQTSTPDRRVVSIGETNTTNRDPSSLMVTGSTNQYTY